jgi:hypothetical protein
MLTNAFSKKWENHWAAMSLWYTFYNFCRIHKSLRVTPAMAAGIANRVWDMWDLLEAACASALDYVPQAHSKHEHAETQTEYLPRCVCSVPRKGSKRAGNRDRTSP